MNVPRTSHKIELSDRSAIVVDYRQPVGEAGRRLTEIKKAEWRPQAAAEFVSRIKAVNINFYILPPIRSKLDFIHQHLPHHTAKCRPRN